MKLDSEDAVQFYTKIQEVHPCASILTNKQVGFLVHVEADKVYKLKNCIDSQKNNADLYKRFSKDFIRNIRKGFSQMAVCCGVEESTRIGTSIGCKKNPGMFLIAGIAILDEKYQQDFMKFDIEISFMEFSNGNMYDLLSYTNKPLKMTKWESDIYFGETYCRVTTFSQFLKILKIALFNNKQRDLKPYPGLAQKKAQEKLSSTFIMTIVTKRYSDLTKSSTVIQKNLIIDWAGSSSSCFQPDSSSQKSVWDYFLMQLNNMTCRKKLHYHLVQPNPLLSLTKNMLQVGKSYILYSFSTNATNFQKNLKFYNQLSDTVDLIFKQTQSNILLSMGNTIKSSTNPDLSEMQSLDAIVDAASMVEKNVKSRKYSSLRQYREMKDKNKNIIDQCLDWIQDYRRLFTRLLENKRVTKLAENQILADQIKLIGVCVKSENYKQFYEAKSYLTLQRQVSIKTESSYQDLIKLTKDMSDLKDKFNQLKSKHWQQFSKITPQLNQISNIKLLINKVLDFMSKIFYGIMTNNQRTIADQILKEDNINENLNLLGKTLLNLNLQIGEMSKNGTIQFDVTDLKKDVHLSFLIKEVADIISKTQNSSKKGNRRRIAEKISKENPKKPEITTTTKKFLKLPSLLSEKPITFQILGNFDFTSLLVNPNQQEQ